MMKDYLEKGYLIADLLVCGAWGLFTCCCWTLTPRLFIPSVMILVCLVLFRFNISFLLYRKEKKALGSILAFVLLFVLILFADIYTMRLSEPFTSGYEHALYALGIGGTSESGLFLAGEIGRNLTRHFSAWVLLGIIWVWVLPVLVYLVRLCRGQLVKSDMPRRDLYGGMLIDNPSGWLFAFSFALLFIAFLIGSEISYALSFLAVVGLPLLLYHAVNRHLSIKGSSLPYVLIACCMICFWISQYTHGILRIVILVAASLVVLCVCIATYRPLFFRPIPLMTFAAIAFVLPVMSLGYNPYTVTDAVRSCPFEYNYAPHGLLLVKSVNGMGIRDRYGIILPAGYDDVRVIDARQSYVRVLKKGLWGIYNLEKHQMVVEPSLMKISMDDNRIFHATNRQGGSYTFRIVSNYPTLSTE
jgi:hypothetical protein